MELHSPVNQDYLDTEVLTKESGPHVIYVTWPEDTFYPHLMPLILEAVPEGNETKVITVAVGTCPGFCEKYQVLFVPTIFAFRRGKLEATISGFLPPDRLSKIITDLASPTTVEQLNERIDAAKAAMEAGLPSNEIAALLRGED